MADTINKSGINTPPNSALGEREQAPTDTSIHSPESGLSSQDSSLHLFDQIKEMTGQGSKGEGSDGYSPVEFQYSSYESDSAVQPSTHSNLDFIGHGDDRLHQNSPSGQASPFSSQEDLFHSSGEKFSSPSSEENAQVQQINNSHSYIQEDSSSLSSLSDAHHETSSLLTDPHAENLAEGVVEVSYFSNDPSSAQQLIGGSGDESFVFDSSHALQNTAYDNLAIFDSSVDLGAINPVGIETINIETALDNYLNISAQDVQNMSAEGHIVVDGGANDIINLQGDWIRGESVDGYTQYTSGDSSISVDDTIVNAGHVNIV